MIFLTFTLMILIFKLELLLISIRGVLKLCISISFNVITFSPNINSSFLIMGTLILYK